MYKSNKVQRSILPYSIVSLITLGIFIIQIRFEGLPSLLILIFYLILYFTIIELEGLSIGLYGLVLSVALEIQYLLFWHAEKPEDDLILAFSMIGFALYYIVIKRLRKQKLEKATQRERHFRSLANFSLQPLILKNKKGEVIFASESIKEVLGQRNNITIGKTIEDLIHPEDLQSHEAFFEKVLKNPYKTETLDLRLLKDGDNYIWVRLDSINLLENEDVRAIVTSIQDVTFQKELDRIKTDILEKEKKARSMAESAVKQRDEFLAIASHELKTPLTTILLQLQSTLKKITTQTLKDFSGEHLMNSLQIAEKQSKRLSELIKDLLNVSVAASGRINLNREKVNLSEITEALVNRYQEEITLSGSNVSLNIKDVEVIGNWDEIRIEQAISNLLMNALKYSNGKDITITVDKDERFGYFRIEDKGIGISADNLAKIFEPFHRADKNNRPEGLGVGLFISKQIALAHKGDILVSSKTGKGSVFILKLPLS